MKKILQIGLIAALITAVPALAGAIKSWANGDTLTAADLNANFQHIHNAMVGGHGARLIDADVSNSAAIASSKLAGYRLLPRAWANVAAGCTGTGACTLSSSKNITSVTFATSQANVILNYTPTNADYAVIVQAESSSVDVFCTATHGSASPQIAIYCSHQASRAGCAGGAAASCAIELLTTAPSFSFVVYDND